MTELSTHVFELDLTSVCVNTGVVQLPMKMQPFFEDGAIEAKVDGESVPLEFSGPRRLGGFRSHFEKRALNANDRVRFELVVADGAITTLTASCIKRERSKPVAMPRPEATAETAASRPTSDEEQAATRPRAASAAGETSVWGVGGGSVRAVRRVTIVGSDALPFDGAPHRAHEAAVKPAATIAPGSPRATAPTRWQPLDGLSPSVLPDAAAEAEFTDTTVRAIRRRGSSVPAAATTDGSSVLIEPRAVGSVPAGESRRAATATRATAEDATRPLSLADLVAPGAALPTPLRAKRPAPVRPRLIAGPSPRAEREHSGQAIFTPPPPAAATGTEGGSSPQLIEERELVPVARRQSGNGLASRQRAEDYRTPGRVGSTPGRTTGPHEAADGRGGARLDGPAAEVGNSAAASVALRPVTSPPVSDEVDLGGSDPVAGRLAPHAFGDHGVAAHTLRAAAETTTSPAVSPRLDREPAPAATLPSDAPTAGGGLEEDVRRVADFVRRPETPAIVRSDFVAERLGLQAERCERALERLSENREQVSRIRKGAYMIRRDVTKRDEG